MITLLPISDRILVKAYNRKKDGERLADLEELNCVYEVVACGPGRDGKVSPAFAMPCRKGDLVLVIDGVDYEQFTIDGEAHWFLTPEDVLAVIVTE